MSRSRTRRHRLFWVGAVSVLLAFAPAHASGPAVTSSALSDSTVLESNISPTFELSLRVVGRIHGQVTASAAAGVAKIGVHPSLPQPPNVLGNCPAEASAYSWTGSRSTFTLTPAATVSYSFDYQGAFPHDEISQGCYGVRIAAIDTLAAIDEAYAGSVFIGRVRSIRRPYTSMGPVDDAFQTVPDETPIPI